MIIHNRQIKRWFLLFLAVIVTAHAEYEKDDGDQEEWVPIAAPQKPAPSRASPRVLNLPPGRASNQHVQAQPYPEQYPFEVTHYHQSNVPILPHSLQRFIYQGEPFSAPQQQINYQPTLPNITQTNNYRDKTNSQVQGGGKEEVQLLYVPVDALKQRQLKGSTQTSQASEIQPVHRNIQLQNIEQDFVRQALQAHHFQQQLEQYQQPNNEQYRAQQPNVQQPNVQQYVPQQQTKKRKPHQPPLAMYMRSDSHDEVHVNDVLKILKDAPTISVQDSVGPESPKVFVGPSNLNTPQGYTKFPLPYLSSIEGNRVERKVENLPFFVAPLNYKTPNGYAKIPFPAPHVGSIVVNQIAQAKKEQANENLQTQRPVVQYEEPITPRTKYRNLATPKHQEAFSPEIPYGPLPSKSAYEASTSNPYGPTPIYTTPLYASSNQENYRGAQSQRSTTTPPREYSTSPRPVSPTVNDKYTVLEQFSIRPSTQEVGYRRTATPLVVKQDTPRKSTQVYSNQGTFTRDNTYNPEPVEYTTKNIYDQEAYKKDRNTRPEPIEYTTIRTKNIYDQGTYTNDRNPYSSEPVEHSTAKHVYDQDVSQGGDESKRYSTTKKPKITSEENYDLNRGKEVYSQSEGTSGFIPIQGSYEQQITIPASEPYHTVSIPVTQPEKQVPTATTKSPIRLISQGNTVPYNENPRNYNFEKNQNEYTLPSRVRFEENFEYNERSPVYSGEKPNRPQIKYESVPHLYEEQVSTKSDNTQDKPSEPSGEVRTGPKIKQEIYDGERNNQQIDVGQIHKGSVQEDKTQIHDGNQHYTLPDELPPINPQLPGFINSLQDQSLRPLLAPLLVPVFDDVELEYVETTTTTTTPAPTVATTTRSRTRGRYRATRPTTPSYENTSHYRTNVHRRRRPTSIRPRPEVSTPPKLETETEIPYYENSPTESPQRVNSNRQRFRTRSRPTKTSEITSTEAPIQTETERSRPKFTQSKTIYQGGYAEDYSSLNHPQPTSEPPNYQTKEYTKPEQVSETPQYQPTKSDNLIPEQIRNRYSYRVDVSTEPEQTTKSKSRTRARARNHRPSTTEQPTTTTETVSDESDEFYGFIRAPEYKKPSQVEHGHIEDTSSTVSAVYLQDDKYNRPKQTARPFAGSSYIPVNDHSTSYPQERTKTVAYDENIDDKPVTHRPVFRFSETTTQETEQTSTTEIYTVRPSKRPETQTQKVTRIRGRIRRPTRPTTTEAYTQEDIATTHHTRGRAHYTVPANEKIYTHPDISNENYPANFLKAQTTQKPVFRLRIEPEEEYEEEIYLPKASTRQLEPVAESQINAKVVARPQNYNALDYSEKTTDKTAETSTTSVTPEYTTTESMENVQSETKTEVTDGRTEMTTEPIVEEVTTASPQKKKGVWRLVRQRPLEMFDSAESQNIEYLPNYIIGDEKTEATPYTEATTLAVVPEVEEQANNTQKYTDSDILDPLFAMFGLNESIEGHTETPDDSTAASTEPSASDQSVDNKETSFPSYLNISTSTEISQETEICYRGKCIKSKPTIKPSDSDLV